MTGRKVGGMFGLIVLAMLLSLLAGSLHFFYIQRDRLGGIVQARHRQYLRYYFGRKFEGDGTYRDDDDEALVVRVFLDPSKKIAKVSPWLLGANLSPRMETEKDIIDFTRKMGVTCLRFPGREELGYHWEGGAFDFTDELNRVPLRNVDHLVRFCRSTGTKPIIRVNVATGTPQEAAAWVGYLNKTAVFPATYWELGGEVYGEEGKEGMTPRAYADLVIAYAQAMKEVDPDIKVGMAWAPAARSFDNKKVVREAGEYVDFVSVHWYPNRVSPDNVQNGRIHPLPAEVMANAEQIPAIVGEIEELFEKYAPGRARPIEVGFLEWDGAVDGPSSDFKPYSKGIVQWSLANALFHLDCYGKFASAGIAASTTFDFQSVGFGYIRGWDKDAGWGGQRWDGEIIRPKAFALKLFSEHFGDTVVASTVADFPYYYAKDDWWPGTYRGKVPYVTAYAGIFDGKNKCSLLLINKHPEKDYNIRALTYNVNVRPQGKVYLLTGPSLMAQNEGNPLNVQIKEYDVSNIEREMDFKLPAHSAMLIQMDIENEKAQ